MGYDLFVTLIGDCITEEALPSYESWIMGIDGVEQENRTGWSQWVRSWTAEENRHGDLLNKYLYLCGRVNMREIEITTQYLIPVSYTHLDVYKRQKLDTGNGKSYLQRYKCKYIVGYYHNYNNLFSVL